MWVGTDHLAACWMNYKDGMEQNVIHYNEDGSIKIIDLDGGEQA